MAMYNRRGARRTGHSAEDDLEASSLIFCRICLESGTDNRDELISPCMCKGTQQFVHRTCLNQWRTVKEGFGFSHCTTCRSQFHLRVVELPNSRRMMKFRLLVARDLFLAFLAMQCVIALIGYCAFSLDKNGNFRKSFSRSWGRVLPEDPFTFYYCIGAIQFLVLAGFARLMMQRIGLGNDPRVAAFQSLILELGLFDISRDSIFEFVASVIVSFVFFVIVGIVFSLLTIAFAVQRIWQKHYDVMNKKELTQEFVVEDLNGTYTPPKLNPEHERRLRTLNLM